MATSIELKIDCDSANPTELLPILLDFLGRNPQFKVHTLKLKHYITFGITRSPE